MSELTICNFCHLRSIRRRAAERGATVDVFIVPEDEVMAGWTRAIASDEGSGIYFQAVGTECEC